ncbi:DUF4177 domain-containing protein [Roseivivax sp. GX 12232]|uniref:DUF4177 domain-containing protein n=1 Tax=Roseivivax sp. GX 12232 TaxID=2900547 RepID=UPI001E502AA3|nr:DUF4177 domain-containing protein [Roseivivax sp. GX 12232]MCE0504159.1 DUF4177 domain-containing protein [Roseivivax sp. GX 12232]
MTRYEYRVLPAPEKGKRVKGVKGAKARFAHSIETLMNDMGTEGWEYVRADTLPSEERAGLGSTVTEWRTLLVFRRPRLDTAEDFAVKRLTAGDAEAETRAEEPPLFPAAPAALRPAAAEPEAGAEGDSPARGLGALLKERAAQLVPGNPDGPEEAPRDGVTVASDETAEGDQPAGAPEAGDAEGSEAPRDEADTQAAEAEDNNASPRPEGARG